MRIINFVVALPLLVATAVAVTIDLGSGGNDAAETSNTSSSSSSSSTNATTGIVTPSDTTDTGSMETSDTTTAASSSSSSTTFDPSERIIVTNQAMGARCAVAADFDGDGMLDIVSASSNDNAVSWFRNEGLDPESGLPSFSIKKQITWSSLGSRIVTVGDIDGDGDMDVVGASYYDMSLRWFENDGTGKFTPHLISSGVFEGQGVAVADINNDGQPDVISASSGDNTIAVFRNIDKGQFCEIKQVVDDNAVGARTVVAADLNGDGWMDLASASKDDDTVAWYPNDGSGNFPTKLIVSAGNSSKGAYSLVAADIDQDGHQDLVVASNGNDRVTLWRNNGKGEFTPTVIFDNADFVLSVTAIDFDKDGDLDVASASFFDGHINWYENVDGKGKIWKNHTIYIGTQGHYVSNGDLDGDGDADLIAVTHAENTVAVYMAHTRCDNDSRDCCLAGTEWNGTACTPCPFGTYGDIAGSGCVACPTDSCTIEGYTHLPATCSDLANQCANVDDNIAACACPVDTMKDPETDVCTVCPEGQIRPDLDLQRQPNSIGNYSLWEEDQGVCYVHAPTDYTPVVVTVAVVGALLLLGLGFLLYRQNQLAKKNSMWKIKEEELVYSDDPVVLGKGAFGEVELAEFRGSKVAVKKVKPTLLKTPEKKEEAKKNKEDVEATTISLEDKWSSSNCDSCSDFSGFLSEGFVTSGTSRVKTAKRQSSVYMSSMMRGWFSAGGELRDEFIKEIRLLSQLPEHRNIVCVMGAVTSAKGDPKLVMEYMERGSLYDLLKSNAPVGGKLIMNIMKDVTSGLRFLHNCNPQVIHSDLKSSNILIDDRWRAKISDFGWGTAGTPYWTAPEVLRGETNYTRESDVWAFGITMFEIYARKLPYQGCSSSATLAEIKQKSKRPRQPATMGQNMASIYKDCLGRKPLKRPTLNELAARLDRLSTGDFEFQTAASKGQEGPVLFPAHVAKALGKGHTVEPEMFANATVCYLDIHDFVSLSAKLTPMKLSHLMHRLFEDFDALADQYGIFKVEMPGGSWMGVTNVVQQQPHDHLTNVAKFSLEAMKVASGTLIDEEDPEQGFLQVQAAFVTGSVEGQVVGVRKPRYSISGPTVEAATVLASSKGKPGKVVCVEADQDALAEKLPNLSFEVTARVFVPGLEGANTLFFVQESSLDQAK